MRCRHLVPLAAVALALHVAPAAAATTGPGVGMTVSAAGDLTLTLGGRPVATGAWRLRPDSYLPADGPGPIDPGTVTAAAGAQQAPGHATVHEEHAAVHADYTYDLTGEDLKITAHVVNADPTHALKPVAFTGVTFHFNPARAVRGPMAAWHWTYLRDNGITLFHPSVANQLGWWFAADDRFAFSVFSESEFSRPAMVTALWGNHENLIPAECQPQFFTDRAVPPGGAVDVTLTFRVTADPSLPHLIQGYKALYDRHFPLPTYTPDARMVCQFAAIDPNLVRRGNPFGYNGNWRRFDTAVGTAAYVRRVAPALKRRGFVGIIFWSLGGYDPPMYPPDFDVLPPAVQANVPALVKGFHDYGLRVGLCARPGDGVRRPPNAEPTIYRLSADDPEQMRVGMDRFRHAMGMGFDLFYLDSIGATDQNDLRILQRVRATVGPDVLLYAEYCSDMTLPYAGRYSQWTRDGDIRWDSRDVYAALRLLRPDATWVCASETGEPIPAAFADLGLTPVVGDQDVTRRDLRWPAAPADPAP